MASRWPRTGKTAAAGVMRSALSISSAPARAAAFAATSACARAWTDATAAAAFWAAA
jgi:hypothetical protein